MSLSRLEATYVGNSGMIDQMHMYGSGLYAYLLAVVVPSAGKAPVIYSHMCG